MRESQLKLEFEPEELSPELLLPLAVAESRGLRIVARRNAKIRECLIEIACRERTKRLAIERNWSVSFVEKAFGKVIRKQVLDEVEAAAKGQ